MNSIKLTRKELYDLVWSSPFTTLAKKYSISDVGLRKMCIRMNIPFPKSGYWMKIKFKKPVKVIKLPTDYTGDQEVTLDLRKEGEVIVKGVPSPLTILEQEIILQEGKLLNVHDRLADPDKLIIAARESLTRKNAFRHNGCINTSNQELQISVSPENINRALCFMDTFIKVFKKRGYSIIYKNLSFLLQIQGQEFEFSLKEKLKRVIKPKRDEISWQEYDFLPTGILRFNVKIQWANQEWKDGKLPLEKQLAKIIATIEIEAERLKQWHIDLEKQRILKKEKERIELEKKKNKEEELSDFTQLLKKAERWEKTTMLRDYIKTIETKAIEDGNVSEGLKTWLLWAKKKADWYDPNIEAEDELLDGVDKETLAFKKAPNPFFYNS